MTDISKVSCRAVVQRLYDYLDGELDHVAGAAIQSHLEVCDACAREAAFEDQVLEGLRGRLREGRTPPALRARVATILRTCQSRGRTPEGGAA
jgi:anti-sigma factor (TIGR02949 family)